VAALWREEFRFELIGKAKGGRVLIIHQAAMRMALRRKLTQRTSGTSAIAFSRWSLRDVQTLVP